MEKQEFQLDESAPTIVLNAEESERFYALMESPPEPTEALKRAMARYRAMQESE